MYLDCTPNTMDICNIGVSSTNLYLEERGHVAAFLLVGITVTQNCAEELSIPENVIETETVAELVHTGRRRHRTCCSHTPEQER